MKKNKLILINSVCYGSTGRIMRNIQSIANNIGFDTLALHGRGEGYDLKCEKYGNFFSFWYHVFLTTLLDIHGKGSKYYTKKMINRIKKFDPNIIWLHNIHGYYLNYPMLFKYLKEEYKGKVIWTLHDCWTFTGHCPHFEHIACSKWLKQCHKCEQKTKYPISLFKDNSYNNYLLKKESFTGVKDLTIITPSKWLEKKVKHSFLQNYKTLTLYNGVDTNKFKKTISKDVYKNYNIPEDKKILISVANVWDNSKGLDKYIELSKKLPNEYRIVLVGMTKKQIKNLPYNIIGIEKVNSNELIKLYSISYLFLNFTKADTFPTVNLEAISCSLPVLSLDTGGCSEQITSKVGKIIKYENTLEEIEKFDKSQFDNKKWKEEFKLETFEKNVMEILNEVIK